ECLFMYRDRIVQHRPDPSLFQVQRQLVPLRRSYSVLMVDVRAIGCLEWRLDWQLAQELVVSVRYFLSRFVPRIQILQLDAEHCGLNAVQSAVKAEDIIMIFFPAALPAQNVYALRQRRIIRQNHSTVAVCPEILCRIKAQATRIPQRTDPPPAIFRSD